MKWAVILLALVLNIMVLGWAGEVVKVTPDEASTWLAETPKAQVVDVRTEEEFAEGHLPNARLIPWTDKDFKERALKELDKAKPVFVYCRTGRRSDAAVAALVKLGFDDIRQLEEGITAWKEAGKPVVKAE